MLVAHWQLITFDSIMFVNSLFFTLQQHQLDGRTELFLMLCFCVDSSTRWSIYSSMCFQWLLSKWYLCTCISGN